MTLITAFEPFDGAHKNYSMLALDMIEENDNLKKALIPVEYRRSYEALHEILAGGSYDTVILVGQAGARDKVTVEKIAINWASANIADNSGALLRGEKLVEDGPDGIFSTVDVKSIVDNLKAKGFDVAVSYTAGTYVCNALYYLTLFNNPDKKVVFVHVPVKDEGISASIIEDIVAQLS